MRARSSTVLALLALSACASGGEPRGPAVRDVGDPLAECTPLTQGAPEGGRMFDCGGFSVTWAPDGDPRARMRNILDEQQARMVRSRMVEAEGLVEGPLEAGGKRLASQGRPLVDVYPLDGARGKLVLWCTYPRRDGSDECRRVAAALVRAEGTSYWAPAVGK